MLANFFLVLVLIESLGSFSVEPKQPKSKKFKLSDIRAKCICVYATTKNIERAK